MKLIRSEQVEYWHPCVSLFTLDVSRAIPACNLLRNTIVTCLNIVPMPTEYFVLRDGFEFRAYEKRAFIVKRGATFLKYMENECIERWNLSLALMQNECFESYFWILHYGK